MKRIFIAFLIVPIVACNTTDSGRPYKSDVKIFKNPYITGKITRISWKPVGQDSLLTVLVEENSSVDEPLEPGGKKVVLSLWESTEIFTRQKDGNTYYSKKENLKVGQRARAWLRSGTILTSYPSQAGASRILVTKK